MTWRFTTLSIKMIVISFLKPCQNLCSIVSENSRWPSSNNLLVFLSEELVAEAHSLCTQLENAMQDTIKEQDQSLRVMAHVNPTYSMSFLSTANQRKKMQRQSSISSISIYAYAFLTQICYS